MIDLDAFRRRNEERKRWEELDELLLPAPLTAYEAAIRDIDALIAEVQRLRTVLAEVRDALHDRAAPHPGDHQVIASINQHI
jgi:hypothetical protein